MNEKLWQLFLNPDVLQGVLVLTGKDIREDIYKEKISDAVIINLLKEKNINILDRIEHFVHMIPEKGQIAIIFGNKYSYLKLKNQNSLFFNQVFSLRRIKRMLFKNGFETFKIYSMRPRGQEVFEISDGLRMNPLCRGMKDIILNSRLFKLTQPAYILAAAKKKNVNISFISEFVNYAGLSGDFKCLMGHPNTVLLVFETKIIRLPLNSLSEARCRLNSRIIKKLELSDIAEFVPKLIHKGKFKSQSYFIESKMPGRSFDEPGEHMSVLVSKAAEFITQFHENNFKEIIITNNSYKRLFGRGFKAIGCFLNNNGLQRLKKIDAYVKAKVTGKKFKTVFMHGDFKVENVLFDPKNQTIKGIIDWDLSDSNGLPLLDLFYLLIYKNSLDCGKPLLAVFKEKFLPQQFNSEEQKIINTYLIDVGIKEDVLEIMLIMFWVNHISKRYAQQLRENREYWMQENVIDIADAILKK